MILYNKYYAILLCNYHREYKYIINDMNENKSNISFALISLLLRGEARFHLNNAILAIYIC